MLVAFVLTMPSVGSWNGQWSGAGGYYARSRTLSKAEGEKIAGKSFRYQWDDGWAANIEVKQITSAEKQKLMKNTQGFCGYEWMIDSIITHGEIRTE